MYLKTWSWFSAFCSTVSSRRARLRTVGAAAVVGAVMVLSGVAFAQESAPPPNSEPQPASAGLSSKAPPQQGQAGPQAQEGATLVRDVDPSGKGNQPVATETPTGPVTGAPAIRMSETTKDFGQVWATGTLTHDFIVRNEGDQVLKLLSVKPSCGCTVAQGYDTDIPAGGQGKIPVSMDSKKLHGKFSKTVTVNSNDPVTPVLRLSLMGEVKQYVELSPQRLNFSHIKNQEERSETITITNNSDKTMQLALEGEGTVGPFTLELVEKEPGKVVEAKISAKPPYQPKLNNAQFTLTTNVPEQPKVDLMVSAYIPPRLEVRPEQIVLSSPPTSDLVRPIRLVNNGESPVKVVSAEADDEDLQVSFTEQEPGKTYEVKVTVPAGYEATEQSKQITLKTDDAEYPEIKIPLSVRAQRTVQARPAEQLIGKPAPQAAFTTFDGKSLTTGESTGQVTLLDFYATWCGWCKKQIPTVSELYQRKYADNPNVRFIALSQDQLKSKGATGARARSDEEVKDTFANTIGGKFENALDPEGVGKSKFQVSSFPTLMLLGKDGVVEAVHFGAPADLASTLETQIDLLLAGKTHKDFPSATPMVKPAVVTGGSRGASTTASKGLAISAGPENTGAKPAEKKADAPETKPETPGAPGQD